MAYREKAEMTPLDEIEEQHDASIPPGDREPESPFIWLFVSVLAIEAALSFWTHFDRNIMVGAAATDVVLLSLLRVRTLLVMQAEKNNKDELFMGYICKALHTINEETPIDKRKGVASIIQEYNRNKLTYPQAMEVAQKVSAWKVRAD